MPAYVITDNEVTDPAGYEEYRKLARPIVEAFGGKFLVSGGAFEVLEGDWRPRRLTVLEFESVAQAKRWWASPEYRSAKQMRQRTANSKMIVVEGKYVPAGAAT